MPNGDISAGELFRITQELRQGFSRVEAKLDSLLHLPTAFEAHLEEDQRRFSALEDAKTWVVRGVGALLIGTVFTALLAVVKL